MKLNVTVTYGDIVLNRVVEIPGTKFVIKYTYPLKFIEKLLQDVIYHEQFLDTLKSILRLHKLIAEIH